MNKLRMVGGLAGDVGIVHGPFLKLAIERLMGLKGVQFITDGSVEVQLNSLVDLIMETIEKGESEAMFGSYYIRVEHGESYTEISIYHSII